MELKRKHNKGHRVSLLSVIFLQLLSAIGPGCSVKESRDECPCMLSLIFGSRDRDMISDGVAVRIDVSGKGGIEVQDSIFVSDESTVFRTAVGRGTAQVLSVWPSSTIMETPRSDTWIRIPDGMQCPEIWTGHASADTDRDAAGAEIHLCKNYCKISMTLIGCVDGMEFLVRGNVCGYGPDGMPAEGPFSAHAVKQEEGTACHSVTVPRQKDNSLKLDIISSDGFSRTFAIGNFIDGSGYDWYSEDLKDINLEINYAASSVKFTIDKWSTTIHFETVI
ncbi:MAG: hypothetical protein ACI3ZC_00095 [Candidatus Cryptobacteroides sp.]